MMRYEMRYKMFTMRSKADMKSAAERELEAI